MADKPLNDSRLRGFLTWVAWQAAMVAGARAGRRLLDVPALLPLDANSECV